MLFLPKTMLDLLPGEVSSVVVNLQNALRLNDVVGDEAIVEAVGVRPHYDDGGPSLQFNILWEYKHMTSTDGVPKKQTKGREVA